MDEVEVEINSITQIGFSDITPELGRESGFLGVDDLVIVDTEDALLIARRDHSQGVGKIVKELGLTRRTDLI